MDKGWRAHGPRLQPDRESERARAAWLLSIDLANEVAGGGFLKVYDTPGKRGRGGSQQVSLARRIALYIATTMADVPARSLGLAAGVHRSTISHHLEAVEDLRDDPVFDAKIDELGRRFLYRAACLVMGGLGLDLSATDGGAE